MSQYEDQPDPGAGRYGDAYGSPSSNPYYAPERQVEQPRQVRLAVLLIWTGVALSVLSTVLSFVMLDELIDVSVEQQPGSASALDRDTLRTAVIVGVLIGLVIGVAIAALFAVFIGKGHNWARITYTVLAALGLVFGLLGIANQPPVFVAFTVVGWALTITVLVLLYQRDSNAYFRSR